MNIKIVKWILILIMGASMSAYSNTVDEVIDAVKEYFVIGDYVLKPGLVSLSYSLRRVDRYNIVDSRIPNLEKVLATESGRFISSVRGVGYINYSQELDRLVVTRAPYTTKISCEVIETDHDGGYSGKTVTEYYVPAKYYRLSLYVDGIRVASDREWVNLYYPGVNNEDIPEVYELALDLRRHLVSGVDSYLEIEIQTQTVSCDPGYQPLEDGDTVVKIFEIDSDNDTIPDYLYPWFELKRQQFLSIIPALYLLAE